MRLARAATAFALLGTAAALPAAAAAQDGGDPQRLGFAVQPVDSPKGYLDLKGKPGRTVRGALIVSNPGRKPVQVLLRAQDAGTASGGGLQYTKPKGAGTGSWLKLSGERIRLAPGKARTVRVRVKVPRGVRSGDHLAGVVAYNQRELNRNRRQKATGAVNLKFVSRFAVAVRVRVPGPATASLGFGGLEIESNPSGASIIVGIDNPGDRLIGGASGQVTVTQDGRELLNQPISIAAFVPKTSIKYGLPWEGAPSRGTYRVQGFVTPKEGEGFSFDEEITFGEKESEDFEASTGLQAVGGGPEPWMLLALGALALALLTLTALLLRRRPAKAVAAVPTATAPVVTEEPVVAFTPPVAAAPASPPVLVPAGPPAPPAPPRSLSPAMIDINHATEADLIRLPGIGPAAAQRIVAHRDEYGDFESVEQLAEVEGFDEARVARLAGRAAVG